MTDKNEVLNENRTELASARNRLGELLARNLDDGVFGMEGKDGCING